MRRLPLTPEILLFQFDPEAGGFEGLNFLVLLSPDGPLFIDGGYEENMAEALPGLELPLAGPPLAVATHFHPDHVLGFKKMPGVRITGSARYAAVIAKWLPKEDAGLLAPSVLVDPRGSGKSLVVRHGRHRLELFPLPGHSDDSIAAIIDDRFLHVGDTILRTNDGRPILPSVHSRPVGSHILALERLRELADLVFIPGHGSVVPDREERLADIENRLRYLEALVGRNGNNPISLDEATAACPYAFVGESWHSHNYL